MEFGFSTGFATKELFKIDFDYLDKVSASRFNFIDLPIVGLVDLTEDEFKRLIDLDLYMPCACNFLPSDINIFNSSDSHSQFFKFLDIAFDRIYRLGIKNIGFGSPQSRNIPSSWEFERGYDEFLDIISKIICPYLDDNIKVLIEPINRNECNLITTIEEGLEVVKQINDNKIKLLADIYHMELNNEDLSIFPSSMDFLDHVHICGPERALPDENFTLYIENALLELKKLNYNKTISYEAKDGNLNKAYQLVHDVFIS